MNLQIGKFNLPQCQNFLPDHLSHLNVEISEMLISWYKEAKGVDVPFYLFTDEERGKATFWDEKQMSLSQQSYTT